MPHTVLPEELCDVLLFDFLPEATNASYVDRFGDSCGELRRDGRSRRAGKKVEEEHLFLLRLVACVCRRHGGLRMIVCRPRRARTIAFIRPHIHPRHLYELSTRCPSSRHSNASCRLSGTRARFAVANSVQVKDEGEAARSWRRAFAVVFVLLEGAIERARPSKATKESGRYHCRPRHGQNSPIHSDGAQICSDR